MFIFKRNWFTAKQRLWWIRWGLTEIGTVLPSAPWRAWSRSRFSHCSSSNILGLSQYMVAMLCETAQAVTMTQALSGLTFFNWPFKHWIWISVGQKPFLSVPSFLCGHDWRPSLLPVLVLDRVSEGMAIPSVPLSLLQNKSDKYTQYSKVQVN